MTHGWKVLAEQSFKVAIKVSRNCFHPLLVICLIRDIVPGFSDLFYYAFSDSSLLLVLCIFSSCFGL